MIWPLQPAEVTAQRPRFVDAEGAIDLLNPVLDEWLPRMLIVTLPFTALLRALFGRKRGLYFVDHVAFALHLQAFARAGAIWAPGPASRR